MSSHPQKSHYFTACLKHFKEYLMFHRVKSSSSPRHSKSSIRASHLKELVIQARKIFSLPLLNTLYTPDTSCPLWPFLLPFYYLMFTFLKISCASPSFFIMEVHLAQWALSPCCTCRTTYSLFPSFGMLFYDRPCFFNLFFHSTHVHIDLFTWLFDFEGKDHIYH